MIELNMKKCNVGAYSEENKAPTKVKMKHYKLPENCAVCMANIKALTEQITLLRRELKQLT